MAAIDSQSLLQAFLSQISAPTGGGPMGSPGGRPVGGVNIPAPAPPSAYVPNPMGGAGRHPGLPVAGPPGPAAVPGASAASAAPVPGAAGGGLPPALAAIAGTPPPMPPKPAGPAAPTGGPAGGGSPDFLNKLMSDPNLLEFGLRLMAAGQPQAGATRGPSLLGAVGEAGFGQLQSNRKRAAAQASYQLERDKLEQTRELKTREIEATTALKKETLRLRQETAEAANEIARYRADLQAQGIELDQRQLGVTITDNERKDLDAVMDSDAYLLADEPEQKKLKKEVRKKWDQVRRESGVKPLGQNTPVEESDEKVIEGKRYRLMPDGTVRRVPG